MLIAPITAIFGAEVDGFDFARPFDAMTATSLRKALATHGVLVFRQSPDLSRERLIDFASCFGPLERSPRGDPAIPQIATIVHDGHAPPTENIWHVDHSFSPAPPLAAVLRAVELPEAGGDTLFADLREVWRRLPKSVRQALGSLSAVHDIAKWVPSHRAQEVRALAPPATHPAVMRGHPSGQEILYVNEGYTTGFVGIESNESRVLLDYLLRMVTVPEVQLRLRWRPGTIAVWDNRSMQHYAAGDYFPARRVMERIGIGTSHDLASNHEPDPQSGAT